VPNRPNTTPVAPMNNTTTTWQPQAHFASNTTSTTPQWLLDSGASHHVTADLSNLSLHTPYNGSDDIMIGDGSSLPITHIDSTSFTIHNTSFKLNNVLCVPNMKKNLISIFQFCTSNNVSVEFLPSFFYVKELHTGAILLKGQTKDGVHEWPVPSSLSSPLVAFSSVKTSSSAWHHRLGHPAFSILQHIISHYQLDLSSFPISDFLCNACHCNKSHKLPFSTSTIVFPQPLEIIFSMCGLHLFSSMMVLNIMSYLLITLLNTFGFILLNINLKLKTYLSDLKLLWKHTFKLKSTLYSNNDGEYITLRTFLATHWITHLTTPPHTPEHKGYSEIRHRHIVETDLSLISCLTSFNVLDSCFYHCCLPNKLHSHPHIKYIIPL
jgi:hypothetical protein